MCILIKDPWRSQRTMPYQTSEKQAMELVRACMATVSPRLLSTTLRAHSVWEAAISNVPHITIAKYYVLR